MPARRDIEELLAAKLAAGATIKAAAAELGISEKTARRRLADPAFRSRIAELRREMTNQAIGRLTEAMTLAADELRQLASSPSESVRLKACIALLDLGLKAAAIADIAARVQLLEDRINHASVISSTS